MEDIGSIVDRVVAKARLAAGRRKLAETPDLPVGCLSKRSDGAEEGISGFPRSEDGATDQLRDLRDDGVAECMESVSLHLKGKPIAISYAKEIADHCNPIVSSRVAIDGEWRSLALKCEVVRDKSFPSRAAGVGNDPDAISDVRGANGGSWYAMPLRIIPDLGQVSENLAEPESWLFIRPSKQTCDVLHDCVAWLYVANEPDVFRPESGARALHPLTKASLGYVLAGEPAADDINGNSIGSKLVGAKGPNVIITRNLWPMLRQYAAAIGVDFAERYSLEAAGSLQTQGEPANTGKEVEDVQHPTISEKSLVEANPDQQFANTEVNSRLVDWIPPPVLPAERGRQGNGEPERLYARLDGCAGGECRPALSIGNDNISGRQQASGETRRSTVGMGRQERQDLGKNISLDRDLLSRRPRDYLDGHNPLEAKSADGLEHLRDASLEYFHPGRVEDDAEAFVRAGGLVVSPNPLNEAFPSGDLWVSLSDDGHYARLLPTEPRDLSTVGQCSGSHIQDHQMRPTTGTRTNSVGHRDNVGMTTSWLNNFEPRTGTEKNPCLTTSS